MSFRSCKVQVNKTSIYIKLNKIPSLSDEIWNHVIHTPAPGILVIMGCDSHSVFWRCSTVHNRCQLHQRPESTFPEAPSSVKEQPNDVSAFPRGNTLLHYTPYMEALQASAVFAVHKNCTFPQHFILANLSSSLPSNLSWWVPWFLLLLVLCRHSKADTGVTRLDDGLTIRLSILN